LSGRPRRLGATQAGSGIWYLSSSTMGHGWSVRPAAMAGVRSRHLWPNPSGAGNRRLS